MLAPQALLHLIRAARQQRAAEQAVLFDEHDPRTGCAGRARRREAGGSRADDRDIRVFVAGFVAVGITLVHAHGPDPRRGE